MSWLSKSRPYTQIWLKGTAKAVYCIAISFNSRLSIKDDRCVNEIFTQKAFIYCVR